MDNDDKQMLEMGKQIISMIEQIMQGYAAAGAFPISYNFPALGLSQLFLVTVVPDAPAMPMEGNAPSSGSIQ